MQRTVVTPSQYLVLALLVVAVLGAVVQLAARRRQRILAVATSASVLALSAGWLRVDHRIEGTILATLSRGHGVTVADMVVVPAVAVAAALLWTVVRDGR